MDFSAKLNCVTRSSRFALPVEGLVWLGDTSRPCRFGKKCKKRDCPNAHPEGTVASDRIASGFWKHMSFSRCFKFFFQVLSLKVEQETVKSGGVIWLWCHRCLSWTDGDGIVAQDLSCSKREKLKQLGIKLGSHLARFGMPHDLHNLATWYFKPRNGCPTFGPLGALCRLDAQHWALFRFCWSNLPIMEVNT